MSSFFKDANWSIAVMSSSREGWDLDDPEHVRGVPSAGKLARC
jgi:hypothetical protein